MYGYTYTDFLEYSIPGHSFTISRDETIRSRINKSISTLAGKVCGEYGNLKGRKRKELDSKSKIFHIHKGETASVTELHKENNDMIDELKEWKKTCVDLQSDIRAIYQEMKEAMEEKDKEISNLHSINEDLRTYINTLEKSQNLLYTGKPVSEATKKSRTLKTFISRAEVGLWFAKSFGLELKSMNVSETETGLIHNVAFESKVDVVTSNSHGFDALSDHEKSKIEMVLFLLDKFCVGDSFYHEITMLFDDLPRSYLVKQKRDQLNRMCHITSTPGDEEGAQVSFKELLRERIREFVTTHPSIISEGEPVQVKISGDGARMTRNSNFILISFTLLQSTDDMMTAKGNHTIGVVNGKEDYDTLKRCFKDIFADINELVQDKKIDLDGKEINLEFFLGGDYKFILLMTGLSGATSHYACAWCKVHKDERWNMQYDLEYYNSSELKRTLQDLRESGAKKKSKQNYCCVNPPMLNIELDHVIPDELHLLLRIMDVLIENLVREALAWDLSDNWNKKKSEQTNTHLTELKETIRSCGISFDIWEKRNADGKGSGQYDFTSLLGCDKKKMLKELPSKFDGIIRPETCATVEEIWRKFAIVYGIITCKNPSEEMMTDYHNKAKEWINLFISLREKVNGYKKSKVTPYMHIMVYHIPKFFESYKTVKIFTGQGVEKNNDVARSITLHKSNKWDSTGDILKLESRQWELKNQERSKRPYDKKNNQYWDIELREARKGKSKRIC